MRRLLLTVLLLVVFCAGLAISYNNSAAVSFDYLAGTLEMPLMGLLVAAFILGMLLAGTLNLATHWTLRREARRLQRQLQASEAELRTLRHLPLNSPDAAAAPVSKNA